MATPLPLPASPVNIAGEAVSTKEFDSTKDCEPTVVPSARIDPDVEVDAKPEVKMAVSIGTKAETDDCPEDEASANVDPLERDKIDELWAETNASLRIGVSVDTKAINSGASDMLESGAGAKAGDSVSINASPVEPTASLEAWGDMGPIVEEESSLGRQIVEVAFTYLVVVFPQCFWPTQLLGVAEFRELGTWYVDPLL